MQRSRLPRFRPRLGFLQVLGLLTTFLLVIALFFILPRPQITLTFVVPSPEASAWQPLIKEFQDGNPGIQITMLDREDSEVEQTYTSALELDKSYHLDLVYMDIIWVSKFAQKGWLMDLSEDFTNEELGEFLLGDVNGGRYEEKLYRIPFRTDVGVLYYRKDLLKQVKENPPETFADLRRISKKLQERNIKWGYLWQGEEEGLAAMFVEVLQGYGGYWINPETRQVGLDEAAAIEAVKFLRSTIQQKLTPPEITTYDEEATRLSFQKGDAAFLRNWPAVWSQVNQADSAVRSEVGFTSLVHLPGNRGGGCQGGWGLGIAKTTKHPEAALRAIKFFTSAAAQRRFILETDLSLIPSRRSLFIDPQIVDRYSHYPKLLEVLDYSVLRPPIPLYNEASSILQHYLTGVLTGQSSPQQAMTAAANETRKQLGYN